jgi:hypothetical protein
MSDHTEIPESEPSQVTNLSRVNVDSVQAELIRMHQSAAQSIEAEEVELNLSAALEVQTGNVTASGSALGFVETEHATLQNSAAGAVRSQSASIDGAAAVVVAGNIELGRTYAGVVAGRSIRGERIETLILLSPRVEGNVTTVVDTRGAVIAGLISGLFAGLMFLLGRAIFGRK